METWPEGDGGSHKTKERSLHQAFTENQPILFAIQTTEALTLHHAVHLLHLEDMPPLLLIEVVSCEAFEPPS